MTAIAHHERGGVFIATFDRGNVRQLQRAALRYNRRIADLLQFVERAVQTDEYLRPFRLYRAGCRQGILAVERGKHLLRTHAQRRQPVM